MESSYKTKPFITLNDLKRVYSPMTAQSLMYYKNSLYEQFNNYLRTGVFTKTEEVPTEDEIDDHISRIINAMKPIGRDTVVYRGIGLNEIPTDVVYDLAFQSTTTNSEKTYKFLKEKECCVFIFTIPANTPVIDFKRLDDSEEEILIHPAYKIENILKYKNIDTSYGKKNLYKGDLKPMTKKEINQVLQMNKERYVQEKELMKNIESYRKTRALPTDEELEKLLEELGV
jgi:hypothetical protein